MKISEIMSSDTASEDKALAGLYVQNANLKLRSVQKKSLPKPQKPWRTGLKRLILHGLACRRIICSSGKKPY